MMDRYLAIAIAAITLKLTAWSWEFAELADQKVQKFTKIMQRFMNTLGRVLLATTNFSVFSKWPRKHKILWLQNFNFSKFIQII